MISSFLDIPRITSPSRNQLMSLIMKTNQLVESLREFGIRTEHWDPILVTILVRKLDAESRSIWAMRRPQKVVSQMGPLKDFILRRADGVDDQIRADRSVRQFDSQQYTRPTNQASSSAPSTSRDTAASLESRKRKPDTKLPHCKLCNSNHQLFSCSIFKKLSIETRKVKVQELGVCEKCLQKQHAAGKLCKFGNCKHCKGPHNGLICDNLNRPSVNAAIQSSRIVVQPPDSPNEPQLTLSEVQESESSSALLATALINARAKDGRHVSLRALCDSASHLSFVTTESLQRLHLSKMASNLTANTVGGEASVKSRGVVKILISPSHDESKVYVVKAYVLKKITSELPSERCETTGWNHLSGIQLADHNFHVPGHIDMLLGAKVWSDIVRPDIVRGQVGQPIAQNTALGWVVFGHTNNQQNVVSSFHVLRDKCEDDVSVDESRTLTTMLHRFWTIDNIVEHQSASEEEQLCENMFEKTVDRDNSGRYIVRIPIKPDSGQLGESRSAAIRRLYQMEERFAKNPELKKEYVNFMNEYEALGHMKRAPPLCKKSEYFYIPHHAAGTKKFRVVFDGSAVTSNGMSFNDKQLIGPRLQSDLSTILMRFRVNKIALKADIRKMYRQIKVPSDQLNLQRIVWRPNSNEPIKDYVLTTQTYGMRSAPFCCIRALLQCIEDHEHLYPHAAEVAKQDFYVDDLVTSCVDEDSALQLSHDLTKLLMHGQFELAKWTSNSWLVQSTIVGDSNNDVNLFNDSEDSVLGLKWIPSCDALHFTISPYPKNPKLTKRFVVSQVAKIFDPLGFVSPFILRGKMVIQDIVKSKCDWKDVVDERIKAKWNVLVNEIKLLKSLEIPRWVQYSPEDAIEVHGFCDASSLAYGCAVYVRITKPTGITDSRLVIAKTRVAPLTQTTIPRLELCAASLLSEVIPQVKNIFPLARTVLWTDSMIVLYWILDTSKPPRAYVANRIKKIRQSAGNYEWRHVPTRDNPADLASRGMSAGELTSSKLWWHGPSWLTKAAEEWPKRSLSLDSADLSLIEEETLPSLVHVVVEKKALLSNAKGDISTQYSSLTKLVRVTAWVLKAIRHMKGDKTDHGFISISDYNEAQKIWILHVQNTHFKEEIKLLKKGVGDDIQNLKKSAIVKLSPSLDADSILRCTGRLTHSFVHKDANNPIIIPRESNLTNLIISDAHKRTLHGGNQMTMHLIRQKFWIPSLRNMVKKHIKSCVQCVRQRALTMDQKMSDLPSVRVTPGRPFECCGVDYLGPVLVKARSGRCKIVEKGYVAVFVCMKSKAVHLELVSNLSSNAFIASLSRLVGRRGRVHELYSDNSTTFHGADSELRHIASSWKAMKNDPQFASLMIKWKFITPYAPHHGGLWEAAVKSTKHHLKRVIGPHQLTFEELATLLIQIEACLNSRPIIPLTDDHSDAYTLTPGHFLIGQPIVALPGNNVADVPSNRLDRWKLLQKLQLDFWNHWQTEYLDHVWARTKWYFAKQNAKVGDVVLIRAENTPPAQWPLGVITDVHPGDDMKVRTVSLRCNGTTTKRPITKLVPLVPVLTPSAGGECSSC